MNEDCDTRRANPGLAPTISRDPSGTSPSGLCVEMMIEGGDWSAFRPVEESVLGAAAALTHVVGHAQAAGHATIVLSTDAHVSELNASFRGKTGPTNVLSFPAEIAGPSRGGDEPAYLGDIIIACETVLREAQDQGVQPIHHLQHLVVHGLLHILGYDHQTEANAEEMEGFETLILRGLGVADPYAPDVEDVTV